MLTGKNYMTFDEQLYWGKQHTFDRLNVSFVVTWTEHFLSYFFFHDPIAPSGPKPLTFESSKLHSVGHTTLGSTRLE
jgi:hypothetical protein